MNKMNSLIPRERSYFQLQRKKPIELSNSVKRKESNSKSKVDILVDHAKKNSIIVNNVNNLDYSNLELNSLSYEEALKFDKRTFFQYYISLLKINHSILFSFYPNKDYNSKIMKMFLFFFLSK